ncbi:MAG: O-antigen ligase family protein [Dehalococcoidia bacterium]
MTWRARIVTLGVVGLIAACTVLAAAPALGQEGPDAPPPSVVQPPLPDTPDAPPVAPPVDPPATPAPDPDPPPSAAPTDPGEEEVPEDVGPTPEEIAEQEAAEAEAERQRQAAIERRERLEAARAAAVARIQEAADDAIGATDEGIVPGITTVIDVAMPAPLAERDSEFLAALAVVLMLAGWAGVVALFTALERRDRSAQVVLILLAVLLLDVLLVPSVSGGGGDVLHPNVAGFSVSAVDAFVLAALAARLVSGRLFPVTLTTLWWLAFFAWIGVAAMMGILGGHAANPVFFSGRMVLAMAVFLLVSTIPPERYLGRGGLPRFLVAVGFVVGVMLLFSAAGRSLVLGGPLSGLSWGTLGADGATVLSGLGVLALSLAVVRSRRRAPLLLAAGALLLSGLFATQRAALLGTAVGILILVVAWLTPTGRLRRRVTRRDALIAALTASAIFLSGTIYLTASDRTDPTVPGAEAVTATFTAQGKASSADARISQWTTAPDLIAESPFVGHGLGFEYDYYEPGLQDTLTTTLTHNVVLDLLLRTGLVGLCLFVVALLLTVRDGLVSWRRHSDGAVAALALAGVAALASLAVKGAVESIFEKDRLMVYLGLVVGVVIAARLSVPQPAEETESGPATRAPAPVRRPPVVPARPTGLVLDVPGGATTRPPG